MLSLNHDIYIFWVIITDRKNIKKENSEKWRRPNKGTDELIMFPEDELWLIPKQRLAIKSPFEPSIHFKMDFKSRLSMIVRRGDRSLIVGGGGQGGGRLWPPVPPPPHLLTIGSLSNNDGDGYEKNFTEKVNLLCLKPYLAYSMSIDGNFFWS